MELKIGQRVGIKQGFGYTLNMNGIMKFKRAEFSNLYGTITAILPKQQVSILLDVNNGWSVITGTNCIMTFEDTK